MAKSRKELNNLYHNLRKTCSEMSEHISDLNEERRRSDTEWRYLSEFIHYKNLDEEYFYFRENAHEEVEENKPFSRLTL